MTCIVYTKQQVNSSTLDYLDYLHWNNWYVIRLLKSTLKKYINIEREKSFMCFDCFKKFRASEHLNFISFNDSKFWFYSKNHWKHDRGGQQNLGKRITDKFF